MWLLKELLTINLIDRFYQLFLVPDHVKIIIEHNIIVTEQRSSAQNFEFPVVAVEVANSIAQNKFPDSFLFGAGTSAYQIEGIHNSNGIKMFLLFIIYLIIVLINFKTWKLYIK
jgi:hypothetical protein